jgi:serine protease Do
MKKKEVSKFSFFSILTTAAIAVFCGAGGGFLAVNFADEIPFLNSRNSTEAEFAAAVAEKSGEIETADFSVEKSETKNCECADSDEKIISAAEIISPAVVSIVISKDLPKFRRSPFFFDFDNFFGDSFGDQFFNFPRRRNQIPNEEIETERQKVGGGTGFIFEKSGLVLTNRHVVADEDAEFTIVLSDGREFTAEVLDRDLFNDIGVLQIETEEKIDFPVAVLGDSDEIKIGQKVIAVGNALAEFQNTVTAGVISARGRKITASAPRGAEQLSGLIQTDAAINPGNSGGPLVNLSGEVVGINTAIASGATGIGFAIPINDAKKVIDSVREHGKIVRPFLGVRFLILNPTKAKELQIPVERGALLVGNDETGEFAVAPGSPAEKAGLQKKDVILSVDGEEISLEKTLAEIIADKNVGDEINLKIWRGGEEIEVKLELTKAP